MASAEVGDDVYGDDPTINRLQERAADMFEKEAALFMPSGTMGNQVAVKVHTKPGQEAVIEERGHIYNHELAGSSFFSGVMMHPVRSAAGSGQMTWDDVEPAVHLNSGYADSSTGLICLENTANLAGGSVMTAEQCADVCRNAHAIGIPVHMDGARIFNAAAATGSSVAELTRHCDSVQFCLSKGLGAPVGSVLVGSTDFIDEARAWRKRLGGGMRQAGVLAAAGLVALEHSPGRLHEDHANARTLAFGVANLPGVAIDLDTVVTNIVIFNIAGTGKSWDEICDQLKEKEVLAIGWGKSIRMVTHCDVSSADVEAAIGGLAEVIK